MGRALGVTWSDSRWISRALYDDSAETGHHGQGLLAAVGGGLASARVSHRVDMM